MSALVAAGFVAAIAVQGVQIERLRRRLAEAEADTATHLCELRIQAHRHPHISRDDDRTAAAVDRVLGGPHPHGHPGP